MGRVQPHSIHGARKKVTLIHRAGSLFPQTDYEEASVIYHVNFLELNGVGSSL